MTQKNKKEESIILQRLRKQTKNDQFLMHQKLKISRRHQNQTNLKEMNLKWIKMKSMRLLRKMKS